MQDAEEIASKQAVAKAEEQLKTAIKTENAKVEAATKAAVQPKPTTDPVAEPKKAVAVEAKPVTKDATATVKKQPVEKEKEKVTTAVIEEKPVSKQIDGGPGTVSPTARATETPVKVAAAPNVATTAVKEDCKVVCKDDIAAAVAKEAAKCADVEEKTKETQKKIDDQKKKDDEEKKEATDKKKEQEKKTDEA